MYLYADGVIDHTAPRSGGGHDKKENRKMKRRITVFGKEYTSMMAAARDLGMNYKTMWNRVSRSEGCNIYDIELLATVDSISTVNLQFIGLDGQARYKLPWSQDLQTTREIIGYCRPDLIELYNQANPSGRWNPLVKNEVKED